MRCKSCDYPLWNLNTRQCPECGDAFRPGDYEFVAGSVRFCCPDCRQAYYGTGRSGHLVPVEFDCATCGRHLHMNEMVLLPAEGVHEMRTSPDVMPWLERRERGLVRGWLGTVGMAMTRPARLIRAVPGSTSTGAAWLFMLLTNLLFLAVGQLIPALLFSLLIVMRGGAGGGLPPLSMMLITMGIPLAAGTLLALGVVPLLWVWLAHLTLRLLGGATAPMRRTAHAIYYSAAAGPLTAIPCDCLHLAGRIWWLVSATIMVREAHGCRGWRAAIAVGGTGVLIVAVFLGMLVGIAVTVAGSPGIGGLAGSGRTDTSNVLGALVSHAAGHDGVGPRHATRLLVDGGLTTASFISLDTMTSEDGVNVGTATLDELAFMPANRLEATVSAAEASMPEDVVAHRVGDFVFTYHGADLTAADPELWLVVRWPDPAANATPSVIFVGKGDGSVNRFDLSLWPMALEGQNAHRTAIGLPPLPDPSTVTHDAPASASPGGLTPAAPD